MPKPFSRAIQWQPEEASRKYHEAYTSPVTERDHLFLSFFALPALVLSLLSCSLSYRPEQNHTSLTLIYHFFHACAYFGDPNAELHNCYTSILPATVFQNNRCSLGIYMLNCIFWSSQITQKSREVLMKLILMKIARLFLLLHVL